MAISESFLSIEEHMGNLQPEARACKTPPLEHWILDKDTAVAHKNFDDVDSLIAASKVFNEVLEAQTQVNNMLNEECAHLLRKAQTTLSKNGIVTQN